MDNNQNLPSGLQLTALYPEEEFKMQRYLVVEQLRSLGIEYFVMRTRRELIIDIPTTKEGVLRITATNKGPAGHSKFFGLASPQDLRLPGGKVVKGQAKEIICATVEFKSGNEYPEVTYLLKEPNFAEVIDTAIESLAQVDGIRVTPLRKGRASRPGGFNQVPNEDK